MKFSVIIPAYNAQSYLEACVRSVLHQSEPDWEIILVDDGSTDHTGEICACYAARYPQKITVLRQRNAGLSAARNAGIRAAKGEYLLLLDSDDILTDDALKRLKKACGGLGETPDVVAFEYQCFSQERELAEPKPYLQLPEEDVPLCGENISGAYWNRRWSAAYFSSGARGLTPTAEHGLRKRALLTRLAEITRTFG